MATASPGPSIMPTAKPRRRRWPYLVTGMLFLVAVPITYYVLMRFRTQNDWQAAEAEIDAVDPRWRLEHMLADREPIADADNLALAAIRILAPGKTHIATPPKRYEALFPLDYPVNAEMNPEQIKFLRDNFQRIGKRLDEARELRKYTKGRFPLAIKEDFLSTQIPDHQDIRILAEWLSHDSRLSAQDDEMDNALRSCESCLALGCAFRDDPFLICFLIQCAMATTAIPTMERVMAQGEASDAALLVMQQRALAEYKGLNWATAMRGERAGQHRFFEGVRGGKVSLKGWLAGRGDGFLEALAEGGGHYFPGIYLAQYPEHLRYNHALVEIAKLPCSERKGKLDLHQSYLAVTKNQVTRFFAVYCSRVNDAEGSTRGLLLAAAAAIACERYRLQHPDRAWPKSLDDVVKNSLLDELPRDPINDQPLRYRLTKEGIVVYSIGTDEKDDAGTIDRERSNQPGVDIGVRLWNVNLRRQRPLPAPAEPEVRN